MARNVDKAPSAMPTHRPPSHGTLDSRTLMRTSDAPRRGSGALRDRRVGIAVAAPDSRAAVRARARVALHAARPSPWRGVRGEFQLKSPNSRLFGRGTPPRRGHAGSVARGRSGP